MAKEKKISFNYSLNKRGKSKIDDAGNQMYPAYMKVTFNRTSTRFPVPEIIGNFAGDNYITENELELCNQKGMFSLHEFFYEKLVRYEFKENPDNYSVVGLNSRFMNYCVRIVKFFSKHFEYFFDNLIGDYLTYNRYIDLQQEYDVVQDFHLMSHGGIEYHFLPKLLFKINWYFENSEDIKSISNEDFQKFKSLIRPIFEFSLFNLASGEELGHFYEGFWLFDWVTSEEIKTEYISFLKNEDSSRTKLIESLSKKSPIEIEFLKMIELFAFQNPIEKEKVQKEFNITNKLILSSKGFDREFYEKYVVG